MKYHDYHLRGYSVSDFGKTIRLDLVYDYPNSSKDESIIEFSEVVNYNFIHTGGAIIADISEIPLADILTKIGVKLSEWFTQHGGLEFWDSNLTNYETNLRNEGYKCWSIKSSIGFEGFVIAKSVR